MNIGYGLFYLVGIFGKELTGKTGSKRQKMLVITGKLENISQNINSMYIFKMAFIFL